MLGEHQFVLGARSSHRDSDNDEMVEVHGHDRAGGLKEEIAYSTLFALVICLVETNHKIVKMHCEH